MINLIPPAAKKSITLEYWCRVLSIWFLVWAATFVVGIFLLVPVSVLINLQVSNLSGSAETASQKLATLKDVSQELNLANQQAKLAIDNERFEALSFYSELFSNLENAEVTLTNMNIDRLKTGLSPVKLSGQAANRQALAAFRDRLLALPEVQAVDLPLSNLAKDKDIQFGLTVTMKPK